MTRVPTLPATPVSAPPEQRQFFERLRQKVQELEARIAVLEANIKVLNGQ